MKPNKQVMFSTPWHFAGKLPKDKQHTSLAIINGHADGIKSKNTSEFAMLDYTGVLETPSFSLIRIKQGDKDYKQHQAMLPVKSSGDILVLPTEAGIDTYVYWDKDRYKLHVPEEVP